MRKYYQILMTFLFSAGAVGLVSVLFESAWLTAGMVVFIWFLLSFVFKYENLFRVSLVSALLLSVAGGIFVHQAIIFVGFLICGIMMLVRIIGNDVYGW
jgi:hypothetical protein